MKERFKVQRTEREVGFAYLPLLVFLPSQELMVQQRTTAAEELAERLLRSSMRDLDEFLEVEGETNIDFPDESD